jgi:threonine/homoserine/homoserine lactone efflux protein
MDLFKKYAKKVGFGAIVGDSFMMILACILSSHFTTYSFNLNIILLVVNTYFIPYMINY